MNILKGRKGYDINYTGYQTLDISIVGSERLITTNLLVHVKGCSIQVCKIVQRGVIRVHDLTDIINREWKPAIILDNTCQVVNQQLHKGFYILVKKRLFSFVSITQEGKLIKTLKPNN